MAGLLLARASPWLPSVYEANNPATSNNTASRSNPTYLLKRRRAGEADLKADAIAHNSDQLHKIPGTTGGQAPQTYSNN